MSSTISAALPQTGVSRRENQEDQCAQTCSLPCCAYGGRTTSCWQLPTVGNHDVKSSVSAAAAACLHGTHNIHALHHLAKHDMLAILRVCVKRFGCGAWGT